MIDRAVNKLRNDGVMALIRAILKYPANYRRRRRYEAMLKMQDIGERFSEIYEYNLWSSSESMSGEGSEVEYTKPLRSWLVENIPALKVKTFIDAPCGDFNWMKLVLPHLNVSYLGLDIVPGIIQRNELVYSGDEVKFDVVDICKDKIPDCDLIMVRDCLFHLSFEDIDRFLKNLASTNYQYLFTTSHCVDQGFKNMNITTGDFRLIDLFSEPFGFNRARVVDRVVDYPDGFSLRREMVLMAKKDVPVKLLNI